MFLKLWSSKPFFTTISIFLLLTCIANAFADESSNTYIVPEAQQMVLQILVPTKQLKNKDVLRAVMRVPRDQFVPKDLRSVAYQDFALPIGEAQTISPPFVVAYMTEQLDPKPTDKVLEIGTGSGYQAAILGLLVKEVYTIEIVRSLGMRAEALLKRLKYNNVHCKIGDGYKGWSEAAPFDKIIVTCSPEKVPQPLVDQLKDGGKILIPIGNRYQQYFYLLTKKDDKLEKETLIPAFFVPMTGEAESKREVQPDPKNPGIVGGEFEEFNEKANAPVGWYYTRNVSVRKEENAPQGEQVLVFNNILVARAQERKNMESTEKLKSQGNFQQSVLSNGQNYQELTSHTLQGFAIDGSNVRKLDISCYIRGNDLQSFGERRTMPVMSLTFFDKDRAAIGEQIIIAVPIKDFGWKYFERKDIIVPRRAKEGSIRIGILNGIGEIAFDDIKMQKSEK